MAGEEKRQDQVDIQEAPFPLPIQGTEGLDFSDAGEEGQEPKSEPGKEAVGEKAAEEVMSLEQLAEKFPNLKVKLNVSGVETVENVADAVRNRQKYAGLEKNIDREKQEMRRLVGELERKIAGIEERETRPEPAKEPNLDDPTEFVKYNALEALKPELDQIKQALQSVIQTVEPNIGEANVKRARAIIKANGGNPAEFDAFKDSMMQLVGEEAGHPVTEADFKGVTPQIWAWRFAAHKMSEAAKPASESPNSGKVVTPEGEPKKIVLMRPGQGGGNSGGGGYGNRQESTRNALLKKAQETGDFASALAHFIKPGG